VAGRMKSQDEQCMHGKIGFIFIAGRYVTKKSIMESIGLDVNNCLDATSS
jgi:hypothetical protein